MTDLQERQRLAKRILAWVYHHWRSALGEAELYNFSHVRLQFLSALLHELAALLVECLGDDEMGAVPPHIHPKKRWGGEGQLPLPAAARPLSKLLKTLGLWGSVGQRKGGKDGRKGRREGGCGWGNKDRNGDERSAIGDRVTFLRGNASLVLAKRCCTCRCRSAKCVNLMAKCMVMAVQEA